MDSAWLPCTVRRRSEVRLEQQQATGEREAAGRAGAARRNRNGRQFVFIELGQEEGRGDEVLAEWGELDLATARRPNGAEKGADEKVGVDPASTGTARRPGVAYLAVAVVVLVTITRDNTHET